MILQSDLLGELSVDDSQVFHFPHGLFGFPEARDFALLPAEHEGLYWLQSSEHTALAFVLVDPFLFFDGYELEIADAELKELGDPARDELLVLAVVTLPRTREGSPTANLQGPVALNLGAQLAKQVPVSESAYGVRESFAFPTG